ncbi:hypothetical protein LZZ85_22330 [Terrimonas sp. NA20]|uniref:DUF748 domain-containing protein n=1 Tax=Terrimonas ginsenosidimutans TaxID=2908004 RepID=A0ABS9KXL7_9BACT|nr:hypothetical protein [Terrimonas ginsenosidimutans]MCG2617050.1 hypothetical protein [Terrimonas ginsenosidimutans]
MRTIPHKIRKATSTPKGKLIFFGIIVGLLGIVAAAVIYWGFYRKQIIRTKLEDTIKEKSKGLYKIVYDKLDLDEVAGDLAVTDFSLSYDSMKYLSMKQANDAPPTLLNIKIPSIIVSGVKTPRALIDKEIVGKNLQINDPVIDIIYTYSGRDSLRSTPTREVYEQILGNLNLIKVDTLTVNNARISTRDINTGNVKVEVINTTIRLLDVSVDSASWKDTTRLLFAKQVEINAGSVTWKSKERPYSFGLDSVQLNSASNEIRVGHFHIDPLLPEDKFIQSLPRQDDRFDFSLKGISIKGMNFPALFKEELFADSIGVATASIKIYRDLGYKAGMRGPVKLFPHQSMVKAPLPFQIKKIVLSNAFIEYKERAVISRQAGKVQFYNTYATITNLTNRQDAAAENNILAININTRFLNKAPLRVTWKFYLFHPNGRFDINGNLGTIDATAINALSVPMGPARIEQGTINGLSFTLSGNTNNMTGQVKMLYDDLKVSLLQKDDESKKLEKKKLASFAANIMIKNSNPSKKKEEPRVANVNFTRDKHRSIFHLSWKSLFTGIKESAGIKK